MNENELLLNEERRKIGYRLCEFLISDEVISITTKLSLDEVSELRQRRNDDYQKRKRINPFYSCEGMELGESNVRIKSKIGIWTKYHEKGAVEYLQENIEQINKILDEETDEKQSSTLIKMLHQMEKELKERTEN